MIGGVATVRRGQRRRGTFEITGEVGDVGLGEQDRRVVRAAVGLQAVQHRGRGRAVAGQNREPGHARAQGALAARRRGRDRLAVGRHRGRIADGGEQIGPQGEGPPSGRPAGHLTNRVHKGERVPIGTHRRRGLGRAQHVRHGGGGVAGGEQMVSDARRRCVQRGEALGTEAVQHAAAVGRDRLQQRVADQRVSEPVATEGTFDDQRGESRVETVVGLVLRQAAQTQELVGVEGGARCRDRLQGSPKRGWRACRARRCPGSDRPHRTHRSLGPARQRRTARRRTPPRSGPGSPRPDPAGMTGRGSPSRLGRAGPGSRRRPRCAPAGSPVPARTRR